MTVIAPSRRIWTPRRTDQVCLDRDHPLSEGLVFAGLGALKGSEHFHDSSPFRNHGTLTNFASPSAAWGLTPWGAACLGFDGTDDYVALPSGVPQIAVGLSVSCQFHVTSLADRRTLFHQRSGDYEFSLGLRDSEIRASVYDWGGAGWVWGASTAFTDTTQMHHVAVLADHTAGTLYLDGVSAGGTNTYVGQSTSVAGTYVGVMLIADGTRYEFPGLVADPCIFNRALTLPEIATLASQSAAAQGYPIGGRPWVITPRRFWPVSGGGAPPAAMSYWILRNQAKIIGGGLGV